MSRSRRALVVLASVSTLGALALAHGARGDQQEVAQVRGQVAQLANPVRPPLPPAPGEPGKDAEFTDAITLPTDRKARKSLEAAEDCIKDAAWGDAAQILQSLLNAKEDIFVKVKRAGPNGEAASHWTSIRAEANRLIGTMPPAGLEVYELQYGARARDRLAEARKAPEERAVEELKTRTSAEILADVAQRFLHTKAGAEAAELLGTYHLDRGRPVMAALCFERLLRERKTPSAPLTLLKAALAFHRAGDEAAARQTWQQLARTSPGGVRLGERFVAVEVLRKEVDRMPAEALVVHTSEWPMFKGSPDRTASGEGTTPFLDEDTTNKWEQDLVKENETREWIKTAVEYQEARQQTAALPGLFPIAANGKLVYRDYGGVQAVDVKYGKLQWEQPSALAIDKMLKDTSKKIQIAQWIQPYTSTGTQSILYENSVLGTLSTDGTLVYAIDDLALPPHPQYMQNFVWGNQPNFGALADAMAHNQLLAINLETGKLVWQLGSRDGKGELDDCYFLGPPLPLGGKLYVLTERNAELRLVCLENHESAPGLMQPVVAWSQRLAAVQDRLPADVGRRTRAVHLAYGDGVLVCPTNAGAVLGVDLLTHSLVWAHPYREQKVEPAPQHILRGRPWAMMPPAQSLTASWRATAPVVQDGKVVFTAPDGDAVHCLNLRDGTLLWKAARSDDLYLAGSYRDKVLLVGRQFARALRLADGKQLWQTETGLPSGQGVASGSTYYLPLKSAAQGKQPEVCALDVDSGRVLAHTKTRKNEVPGNLLFYEGKVISQTTVKLAAYPQLKTKLEEMNARIAKNPDDPVGLTERAELKRHNGEVAAAVEDLRRALAHRPGDVAPKARQLLFESLTELFQLDFATNEKYLDEYRELCKVAVPEGAPPEERQKLAEEQRRRQANYLCLVGKGREQQGRLLEAFHCYLEFGGLTDHAELLTVVDEPTVKARPDVWAQGRIAALVAKADPDKRKLLEDEIVRQWLEVQGTGDLARLRRFVAVFGSLTTVGKEARLQLAERLIDENPGQHGLLEAELQLLQVQRQDRGGSAARAVELLARLMTRKGLIEDAAHWYRVLGRDFADVVIRDGKTGADFLNDLATDKRFLPYLDEPRPAWRKGQVKAREEMGTYQPLQQVVQFEPEGEALPFFQRHRLSFHAAPHQLKLVDRFNNEECWSQDLTRPPQSQSLRLVMNNQLTPTGLGTRHPYFVQGHMVVFNLGATVYGVDLVERKVLWETSLLGGEAGPLNYVPNAQGGLNVIYPDSRSEKLGQTGPFEPGYVCLQTRRGLLALDPIRGTPLWSRSDLPAWTTVFGDEEYLFLVETPPDGSVAGTRAIRAHDGAAVDVPDFAALYKQKLRVLGRRLLVSEAKEAGEAVTLRLYEPAAGKDVWRREFPKGTVVLRSEAPDVVGVIEPAHDGKLTVLDVHTQRELLTTSIDPKEVEKAQAVYLLQDRERFYVAINGPPNAQVNPFGGPWINLMNGTRGLPVHGKIYAFDRDGGKLKWWKDLTSQVLVLEQFQDLPVLLFMSRAQEQVNGGMVQVTATQSVQKSTGKLVYDKRQVNNQTMFHTLVANARSGTIDLLSQTMKVQLYLEQTN